MPRDVFPKQAPPARVAIGYPNRRALAVGNLGFRTVAQILGECRGVHRERFYLPDDERAPAPGMLRTEPSNARLSAMDLVLLSICFEGDAPHVPALLAGGGLPARAAERRAGHPLVIGGGAVVMMNPEPLSDFFDLFLVGEAEVLIESLLREWHGVRGASRDEQIAVLAALPGALAPGLRSHRLWEVASDGMLQATRLRTPAALPVAPVLPAEAVETVKWSQAAEGVTAARLPRETALHESLLIELGRGCTRRCRFCLAGRIYAPLRMRSVELLLEEVRTQARRGETIGLLSLCAGDYPELGRLTAELRKMGLRAAISSLPPDFSQRDAAENLVRSGTTTLTIAPETGSERLRALVGKPVANARIIATVRMLGEVGVRHLRTYFLAGLPHEEDADLHAIPALLRELRGALPLSATLSATVNVFVPKPRTPLQWAGMVPAARLREISRILAGRTPWGVRMRVKSFREARQQAALARGDAAWGSRLIRIGIAGEPSAAVLREEGLRLEDLTGPIAAGSPLPWEAVSDARERARLRREWRYMDAKARESVQNGS